MVSNCLTCTRGRCTFQSSWCGKGLHLNSCLWKLPFFSQKDVFWINFCHLAWYICSNSASAVPSKQHRLSRTVHTNHIQILTNRHKPGRNAVTPTKGATLEHYVSDHMAFTMAWIYFAKDCAAYFRSQECAYMCIKYCILYGVFLSI